ncbi:MAG: hypothetical protein V1907_03025 [Candidatus Kerfeldbacteria bacterium]
MTTIPQAVSMPVERTHRVVRKDEIIARVKEAVAALRKHHVRAYGIVYPGNGGRIPARLAAKMFGIPRERVEFYGIRRYPDGGGAPYAKPMVYHRPDEAVIRNRVWILVDDRFHQGETAIYVKQDLEHNLGAVSVVIVTLYYANDIGTYSQFRNSSPFSGEGVPDSVWLDFVLWESEGRSADVAERELIAEGLIDPE